MPLIPKPNYNQIFASQAPDQDKPAVFNNYPEGWGPESRPNNGKPTIKGFNYLQQTSDLKDLWVLQNGACLPYDESIEYAEGAPVLKDGVIQYKTSDGFKSRDSVTIPTYNSAADGVDPVTGVADGAYFNVRSSSDESYVDEYQNVGGVPTPSGKIYPSGAALAELKGAIRNNLKFFGENVGGGGDDSQAFIDAGALDRNYFIPSGTYRVDSSKVNINLHNFVAADKVLIYVDSVAKDYSGAFNGPFRSNTNGGSYFWYNAKTGKTLVRWSDGASASDSHQFYLPLEVRADGHGFMLRQATRGAGIDILYQDELSDDLFYLKVDGTTEDCVFGIAFDTTPKTNGSGGGAGGFDNAIEVRNIAGVARVRFPSAQTEFSQPMNLRRRGSSATRNYQFSVNSANGLDLKAQNVSDGTDIALLMNIQDTQLTLGRETTFLPNYTHTASHRNAFNLVDGGSVARNVKKTFPITTGAGDRAIGEFTVIYVNSGGGIFTRSARFKANGSTVVFEESALNDVLPAALVADVVYDGAALNLVLHNNDYAATMRYTVKLEWLQAYY